jgi:hypothetical protein
VHPPGDQHPLCFTPAGSGAGVPPHQADSRPGGKPPYSPHSLRPTAPPPAGHESAFYERFAAFHSGGLRSSFWAAVSSADHRFVSDLHCLEIFTERFPVAGSFQCLVVFRVGQLIRTRPKAWRLAMANGGGSDRLARCQRQYFRPARRLSASRQLARSRAPAGRVAARGPGKRRGVRGPPGIDGGLPDLGIRRQADSAPLESIRRNQVPDRAAGNDALPLSGGTRRRFSAPLSERSCPNGQSGWPRQPLRSKSLIVGVLTKLPNFCNFLLDQREQPPLFYLNQRDFKFS